MIGVMTQWEKFDSGLPHVVMSYSKGSSDMVPATVYHTLPTMSAALVDYLPISPIHSLIFVLYCVLSEQQRNAAALRLGQYPKQALLEVTPR